MEERARTLAIRLYLPLAVCLLVAGLYSNALRNPFLEEDRPAITANPDVVEPGRWRDLWIHHERSGQWEGPRQYRPLAVASYRLNQQVSGLNPAGFRLVNLALLALVGCVLGWWLTSYVGVVAAWLAVMIFLAHPVQAEAVNLISGRAQLQALLGICLFGWLHRRALLGRRGSVASALGAMAGAAMAIGSDTSGLLVFPLALVQAYLGPNPGKLDLPWLKRGHGAAAPKIPRDLRPVHAGTALLLGIPLALYLWGRTQAIGWRWQSHDLAGDMTRNPLLDADGPQRLAGAFSLATYYLSQLVYPRPSANLIPAQLPTWQDAWVWIGLFFLLWMAGLTLLALRRRHWLAVAGALALGQYLLVGHLLAAAPVYAAQRFALPIALAGTMVLAELIRRFTRHEARRRAAAAISVALAVAGLGLSTWTYNSHCRSAQAMHLMDLERHPDNPIAMYLFGSALIDAGRFAEALTWLEKAADQRPDSFQVRRRLADVLLMLGRPDPAQEQYRRILDHHPKDIEARVQLAEFALARQNLAEAETQLLAARDIAPQDARVWRGLARVAAARDHRDQALRHYQKAMALMPQDEILRREFEHLAKNQAP